MAQYQDAYEALAALDPLDAARLLGDARDLKDFLDARRLSLDEGEIEELRAVFRA